MNRFEGRVRLVMVFSLMSLIFSQGLYGQKTTSPFERHFTWNTDSTIVYLEPDIASNKITKLNYGTEVTILEELKNVPAQFKVETSDPFEGEYFLNGHWIEIDVQGLRGFVFSGEVINFPPHIQTSWGRYRRTPEQYNDFGWNVKVEEEKEPIKIKENTYYNHVEKTFFPDGSYVIDEAFDGCFHHQYYFKGKKINQVYFLLKAEYASQHQGINGTVYSFPKLIMASENRFEFENGFEASQDIHIEIKEDGKIFFGSYDCT